MNTTAGGKLPPPLLSRNVSRVRMSSCSGSLPRLQTPSSQAGGRDGAESRLPSLHEGVSPLHAEPGSDLMYLSNLPDCAYSGDTRHLQPPLTPSQISLFPGSSSAS